MNATALTTLSGQHTTTVIAVEPLAAGAYLLRLERQGLAFTPGQCVILGLPGNRDQREYSIFSPVTAPTLEVLIREVPDGRVSRQLRRCRPGHAVQIEGPAGFFTLDAAERARDPFLFVATGTGIAPFHSMAGSYPDLDYRVLHGVRTPEEAFGRAQFAADRYTLCASRAPGGDFAGRVTDYLAAHPVSPAARCLLCGNVRMIDAVYDILAAQGVGPDRIRAEVYF